MKQFFKHRFLIIPFISLHPNFSNFELRAVRAFRSKPLRVNDASKNLERRNHAYLSKEQSLGTSARDKSRELRRAANFSTPGERAIFPAISAGKYCRRVLTRIFSTSKRSRINGGSSSGELGRSVIFIGFLVFAGVARAKFVGITIHLLFRLAG